MSSNVIVSRPVGSPHVCRLAGCGAAAARDVHFALASDGLRFLEEASAGSDFKSAGIRIGGNCPGSPNIRSTLGSSVMDGSGGGGSVVNSLPTWPDGCRFVRASSIGVCSVFTFGFRCFFGGSPVCCPPLRFLSPFGLGDLALGCLAKTEPTKIRPKIRNRRNFSDLVKTHYYVTKGTHTINCGRPNIIPHHGKSV